MGFERMKTIQTAGGPLIGLDQDVAHRWCGNFGSGFVGENGIYSSDYDAAGAVSTKVPPVDVGTVRGEDYNGLLISMPFRTAIVGIEDGSVYIAQVENANMDWSFSKLGLNDFLCQNSKGYSEVKFESPACTYILFDAAYAYEEVGDDCLKFPLREGRFVFSACHYNPDPETSLILYRIREAA